MCDPDRPSFMDESRPRARKIHRCSACDETIAPGQTYVRIFGIWDGEPRIVKHCLRCSRIADALLRAGAETVDLELSCDETWEEAFGEEPPEEVAALAFALPEELK